MTSSIEVYWSIRSPYSYLATDRLVDIKQQFGVDIDFRPVRPLALREGDFFTRARKQLVPYLRRDMMREATRLGIKMVPPNPDPIIMDMGTGVVAPEQPYMDRIMPLSYAAVAQGRGIEFAQSVARRIWGGVENWHEDGPLGEAAEECGLSLAALDDWATSHPDEYKTALQRNEADQLIHHWGVPLMVFEGEPFFGQDRVDSLIWRLEQAGLRRN